MSTIKKKNIYKVDDKLEAIKPLLLDIETDDDPRIRQLINATTEIIGNINYSMRCSKEFNFFSLILDKVNILVDVHLHAPMACNFVRNRFNIYVNPFLAFQFDKYYIRAFLIHEVYHIIMHHIFRGNKFVESGKFHHSTVNIGLDVAINQFIDYLDEDERFCNLNTIGKHIEDKNITIESNKECEYYINLLSSSAINNPTPEEILQKLEKMLNEGGLDEQGESGNQNQDNDDQEDGDGNSNGENEDNQDGDDNGSSGSGNNQSPNGRDNRVCKHLGGGNDLERMLQQLKDGSAEIQEHVLKEMLRDVSSKCRGTIPGGIEKVIEEMLKEPIIRWQDVLKNYMGRLPIPFKRTRSRLSRRLPDRLDLMGKLPDAFYRIVIAIDTSGSMSDEDVALCFNEIWSIINTQKKRFEITVIDCDCQVQQIYEVKRKSDFRKIKRTGYGKEFCHCSSLCWKVLKLSRYNIICKG